MNALTFLGTGAADWPSEVTADPYHRRLSSAIVNEKVLIDCGPAVPEAIKTFNISPADITNLLITHSHSDHFDLSTLAWLTSQQKTDKKLTLWADPYVIEQAKNIEGLTFCPLAVGQAFNAEDFTVTALKANHMVEDSPETSLHYLFSSPETSFFYATDGAWFLKETAIALQSKKLDAIIMDATIGEIKGDYRIFEHNNLDMVRIMRATLIATDSIKADAKVVLTHLAKTLHPSHEEIVASLGPEGFTVAYDGLKLIMT